MPILAPDSDTGLFDDTQLTLWLGRTVTPERWAVVEGVVWGWLQPILGTAERPSPVPPSLFSWAIELGAIAHENPAGLSERDIGPYGEKFSAERRQAILDEVAGSDLAPAGNSSNPQGSFPAPCAYPDPAF